MSDILCFLHIMSVRFIHVIVYGSGSFFSVLNSLPLYPCTTVLVHSPLDGHLDRFQLLGLYSNAAVSILISWCICAEASNEYMPRVELLGQGHGIFNLSMYCQTVFQSDCTDLQLLAINKQPLHSISCHHLVLSLWF